MSGANQRRSTETENAILLAAGAGILTLGLVVVWVAAHGAAAIDGRPTPPMAPVDLYAALARGSAAWTSTAWLLVALQAAVAAGLGAAAALITRRARAGRRRGDSAARLMGTGRDIATITTAAARATAARLGVEASPGIRIGATVTGGQTVWQGWEDVSVDIWGPRQGKTTSRVIPAIVEAPGAVVVTSNKRDVVDATRYVRQYERADGTTITPWVFDPQHIVAEPATWWWDPLSYVTGELAAAKLAHTLAAAARPPGSRVDAFFDSAAEELLAGLLLAASMKPGGSLIDVYLWLTKPTDTTPADILAASRFTLTASSVANHINSPDKQRDGVFGTARTMVRFMTNPETMAWVTPDRRARRRRFVPAEFVQDPAQTIYLLSKEGHGSAGPIMTALTVAITEAAEDYSQTQPDGRLPVPMLLALDEAANICRWADLPNLYSHFGSRGIIPMTILQSWAQGEEVWGKAGMEKLWAAATIKVVGSGVGGGTFLSEMSALIGEWEKPTRSYQSGRGAAPSHTTAHTRERIMDPADIAALPRGRAIVAGAGSRPALCRTIPWMDTAHASAIRASIHAATAGDDQPNNQPQVNVA